MRPLHPRKKEMTLSSSWVEARVPTEYEELQLLLTGNTLARIQTDCDVCVSIVSGPIVTVVGPTTEKVRDALEMLRNVLGRSLTPKSPRRTAEEITTTIEVRAEEKGNEQAVKSESVVQPPRSETLHDEPVLVKPTSKTSRNENACCEMM